MSFMFVFSLSSIFTSNLISKTYRVGEHRCAGIPPTASGGQASLIPYEFLLAFLFPRQPLLLCLRLVPHSCTFFSARTSLNLPYFSFCPALSLPKSCCACPLQVPPPAYFLSFLFTFPSRTSLYCGFYLYYVCNVFFLPLLFYWDFPENCICTK